MSRRSVRTMSTRVTNWIHALKNKRECHEYKATEQLSKKKRKHTHACMHTHAHMHARTCTHKNTVQWNPFKREYLVPSNLNPFLANGNVHALLVYCLLLQLVSKRVTETCLLKRGFVQAANKKSPKSRQDQNNFKLRILFWNLHWSFTVAHFYNFDSGFRY